MARLIVYEGFIEARNTLKSERIGQKVDEMLRTIEMMPGVGSSLVPSSIQTLFGSRIRKVLVSPFEIIYEYDPENDIAYVYDLLYAPTIR